MRRYFRRGQSILEYTLLLAVIIAVIVAFLLGSGGQGGTGGLKGKLTQIYEKTGTALDNTKNDLTQGVFK